LQIWSAGYGFEKSSLAVLPQDNQKTTTRIRVRVRVRYLGLGFGGRE
jgi:hypothetical protein